MVKRSSIGSIVRKRLSDIKTSLPQLKPSIDIEMGNRSTKNCVDDLIKFPFSSFIIQLFFFLNWYNSKIIEMTGMELKKLRVGVQRVQLQNWNLAQSNSHMLAELHLNKEKVKALQHELICKDAVLKAKSLDLKEAVLKAGKKRDVKDKETGVGDSVPNADINPSKINRKPHASKSRSMGSSAASQQAAEKGSTENKRHCLRRQSASPRMQQQEPAKRVSEFEDIARQYDSLARAQEEDLAPPLEHKSCCSKRTSLGRPLRRAAGRVQSYKQVPLNVKMRRSD
nr:SHUGOSHIN 2 isoform X2 [Ipomoea batatas]